MRNSIEKFATYDIANLTDAVVFIVASIIVLLIEIGIAYIIYRIIKRLIRYGIDYYFYRREIYETNRELDDINIDMLKKENKFHKKQEEET